MLLVMQSIAAKAIEARLSIDLKNQRTSENQPPRRGMVVSRQLCYDVLVSVASQSALDEHDR